MYERARLQNINGLFVLYFVQACAYLHVTKFIKYSRRVIYFFSSNFYRYVYLIDVINFPHFLTEFFNIVCSLGWEKIIAIELNFKKC